MAFLSQRLFISFEIDFTSAWQIGSYGGHAFWIDTLSSSILKFVNSLRMFLSLVIWDHSFDIMLKVTCNNNVFDWGLPMSVFGLAPKKALHDMMGIDYLWNIYSINFSFPQWNIPAEILRRIGSTLMMLWFQSIEFADQLKTKNK